MTKNKTTERIEHIDKLRSSFKYMVDYDYDTSDNCDQSCHSGICRCSIITNTRVNNVDIEYISDKLVRKADKNSILHYCIERILVSEKLYDPDAWCIDKTGGYYGEEIGDVTVDMPTPIIEKLNKLISMTNVQRIRHVLIEEYGYLLPRLEAYTTVAIHKVKLSSVLPADNYYRAKVDGSIYRERELPYCIVEADGEKFKIIDGHHRYAAASYYKMRNIPVLVLT